MSLVFLSSNFGEFEIGLLAKLDHFAGVCEVAWPLNENEGWCFDKNLTAKARRFLSKQGQHQPHFHSKARQLTTHL